VDAPPLDASPAAVARGQELYARHCMRCHGIGTKSGGLLPDLRFASREVHAQWRAIVIDGLRSERGMASFADVLTPDDAEAIHAYVIAQALRRPSLAERAAAWLVEKGACIPAAWVAD
jgi:mono/diheme cytochrome c family protein